MVDLQIFWMTSSLVLFFWGFVTTNCFRPLFKKKLKWLIWVWEGIFMGLGS